MSNCCAAESGPSFHLHNLKIHRKQVILRTVLHVFVQKGWEWCCWAQLSHFTMNWMQLWSSPALPSCMCLSHPLGKSSLISRSICLWFHLWNHQSVSNWYGDYHNTDTYSLVTRLRALIHCPLLDPHPTERNNFSFRHCCSEMHLNEI